MRLAFRKSPGFDANNKDHVTNDDSRQKREAVRPEADRPDKPEPPAKHPPQPPEQVTDVHGDPETPI
jgi:hypothetical protein